MHYPPLAIALVIGCAVVIGFVWGWIARDESGRR